MGQWVGGCGTMNAKEDTVVAVVAWDINPPRRSHARLGHVVVDCLTAKRNPSR